MKVSIIVAITVDGFIGRNDHHTSIAWTSVEDKRWFREFTKQTRAVVMGAKTFATFKSGMPGRKLFIYTHKPENIPAIEGVEATNEAPAALIARLAAEGYSEVAICGGATVYRLFLEAGVVDELYITVEPKFFGEGVKLFDQSLETQLKLLESSNLNDNTLLLHYRVER